MARNGELKLCHLRVPLYIIFQAVAGLLADARQVVEIARDEASNYRSNFGSSIPLKVCMFWIIIILV